MRRLWLLQALIFCTVIVFTFACGLNLESLDCQEGDCKEGYYCMKSVGDCGGRGVCTEMPDVCTETPDICTEMPDVCPDIYDPVCGCDGETYSNDCIAAAAGVNVDYEGECKDVCKGNDNCEKGYYCAKPVGDCEGTGVCTEISEGCSDIWDPVCGCDGKTYANDCIAAAAGENVDYEGECEHVCKGNDNCEKGYYCEKPVGQCFGEGVCALRPEGCPDVWDPVCGCDGKTYANDCIAAAAGENVDYEGECEDIFCPRSQGYWKNHPESWPVEELMIGAEYYNKDALIIKLKTPPKGDMELILIKQLIAAKLNKAAGADTSSIDQVIQQADDCMESRDCSRNTLEDLKDKLDRFNNSGDEC